MAPIVVLALTERFSSVPKRWQSCKRFRVVGPSAVRAALNGAPKPWVLALALASFERSFSLHVAMSLLGRSPLFAVTQCNSEI